MWLQPPASKPAPRPINPTKAANRTGLELAPIGATRGLPNLRLTSLGGVGSSGGLGSEVAPLPRHSFASFWERLHSQPTLDYALKYCRLSRRVRKILKNKYRYTKYFFVVPPSKRFLFTMHLWKYSLKFHTERNFSSKLSGLFNNLQSPRQEALIWTLFYVQQRLALKRLLNH